MAAVGSRRRRCGGFAFVNVGAVLAVRARRLCSHGDSGVMQSWGSGFGFVHCCSCVKMVVTDAGAVMVVLTRA